MDRGVAGKRRTDLSALLPHDELAAVLVRLPRRSLAVSRCVCENWRAVIHAHPLLRAELFPRSLAGVLVNFQGLDITEFFCPSTDAYIFGERDYLPDDRIRSWSLVRDHCNGLLLIDGYVLNPAKLWRAPVPKPPAPRMGVNSVEIEYLVYDPLVSLHYEVFLVPRFNYRSERVDISGTGYRDELNPVVEQSEWPPSRCILNVFSSKTKRWEERAFVREGAVAGTVAHMRSDSPYVERNAVYWQGSLYVHCQTDFILRISLSDNKFQVIKPPVDVKVNRHPKLYLGKSEKGVYFAMVYKQCSLRVWFLDESSYPMEWVLKHDADLAEWARHKLDYTIYSNEQRDGPWILQDINRYYYFLDNDINHYYDGYEKHHYMDGREEFFGCDCHEVENFEWRPDNENTGQRHRRGYIDILGFHPFKEIIFLSDTMKRGLVCNFNSSKVEDLGDLYPTHFEPHNRFITSSFPYTPCWM